MVVKELTVIDQTEEENNLDSNMKIVRILRLQYVVDVNMVRVFLIIWLAATILAIPPIFRPKHSDVEKRDLKTFPQFSFSALVSGDYFDEISLWFSDTFPLRDGLVALNKKMTNSFGINSVQVVGNVEQGDEIPDISSDVETPIQPLPEPQPEPEVQHTVEQLGGLLVVDNTAYEYFAFNQATADQYAGTINRAAMLLEGKARVYDMIIPKSMAITLPDDFKGEIKSSDQPKSIEYMYSRMASNVTKVSIYPTLKAHKDEYIYFRTDHHWTALGAYYAYRDLMTAAGRKPAELSAFKEYRYDGFLGTFASRSSSLKSSPDYVMAYEPTQLEFIYTYSKIGERNYYIVGDGNPMSAGNKYMVFAGGDQPYGVMTNPTITDGSSCLVIKESFGNAMVGYLTQNYQYVHVVDYRHIKDVYTGTIEQFVTEKGIQDVYFVNNISATCTPMLVNDIGAFVG